MQKRFDYLWTRLEKEIAKFDEAPDRSATEVSAMRIPPRADTANDLLRAGIELLKLECNWFEVRLSLDRNTRKEAVEQYLGEKVTA